MGAVISNAFQPNYNLTNEISLTIFENSFYSNKIVQRCAKLLKHKRDRDVFTPFIVGERRFFFGSLLQLIDIKIS